MRRIIILSFIVLLFSPAVLWAADSPVFDHDFHVKDQGVDCSECHHSGDLAIQPPVSRCEQCHENGFAEKVRIPVPVTHDSFWYKDHGPYAKKSDRNCETCHVEQKFCLDCHKAGFADEQGKAGIHRSDFLVTHPILARADDRSCTICHEDKSFCVDCHNDFQRDDLALVSHRRGFSDISAGLVLHDTFNVTDCQNCHTNSVLPTHDWTEGHAREARRNLPTCQACHPDADVCLKCHSAREGLIVNPHPANWGDIKDTLNGASDGKTCRRCH